MACTFNIKTTFLSDASAGGQWELVGYSITPTGTFGAGGSWPWENNVLENPAVDFGNIQQGYYKLNYFVQGVCGGVTNIIIPVVGNGDAGITKTMTVCTDSGVINLATELGAVFDGGVLEAAFSYEGTGIASLGYDALNSNTPIDDSFDPSVAGVGTYIFTLTISPQTPSGYELAACCVPTTASLIINVEQSDLQIAIDGACNITLASDDGCEGATIELHKSVGGGAYTPTGITTLPYQAMENANWKLVATGCDCGTVESNVVDSTGCCDNGTLTMYFDPDFCAMFLIGTTGCSGGTFKWYKSCDDQQTWEHIPGEDNSSFIFVNDNCCYQVIKECTDGCKWFSNVDCAANCAGGCNGGLSASYGPCTYTVEGGTYCNGGTLSLIKVGTGVVQTIALTGANPYPLTFTITSDGTYSTALACNDGCPDYTGPSHAFTGCGGSSCNTTINATVTNCVITATVTNCPNPIFQFINPSGTIVYTGPNNSLAVDVDGLWQVKVDGCPDCPQLSDTVQVTGCESSTCDCVANITEANCAQFTLNLTGCTGYSIFWQYRLNAGASWATVQTGGLTYNGSQNGQYRVLLTKSGCANETSNTITVTCFSTGCDCAPTLALNSMCELVWSTTGCSGYTIFMQMLINNAWVDIATNPSSPWEVPNNQNGTYRLKATKSGCPTYYSNPVNVQCSIPGCTVNITSFIIDPTNCNKVLVEYTGAGGNDVTAQFTKATANPTDCETAGGWAALSGSPSGGSQGANGTGSFWATLDETDCDRCIRVIVNANAEGCGSDVEYLFVPCCCVEVPDVTETPINEVTKMRWTEVDEDPITTSLKKTKIVAGSSDYFFKRQLRKTIQVDNVLTENVLTETPDFKIRWVTKEKYESIDYVNTLYLHSQSSPPIETIIDLTPTNGMYFTGAYGTVVENDMYFANVTPQQFIDNTLIRIKNAIKSVLNKDHLIHYEIYGELGKEFANDGVIFYSIAKRNDSAWLDMSRMKWDAPIGVDTNDATEIYQDDNNELMTITHNASCGDLTNTSEPNEGFIEWENGNPGLYLSLTGSTPENSSGILGHLNPSGHIIQQTIICAKTILEIINECEPGATYLWSTGEDTETITVPTGNYSCVVTCPDGCEYTVNITV